MTDSYRITRNNYAHQIRKLTHLSATEIARRFGVTRRYIQRICEEHNIRLTDGRIVWPQETLEQMVADHDAGETWVSIANRHGTTDINLHQILKCRGMK